MSKTVEKTSGVSPEFFRASCHRANDGTTGGYRWAGHSLIGHVSGLAPNDVEEAEWLERVATLASLIVDRDDGVLAWFDSQLPRCMALVPRPRRGAFLRGVYQAVNDEGLNLLA